MNKINPNKVLFIKLGKKVLFEQECLLDDSLMIDYNEIDYNFCLNGDWNKVEKQIIELDWGCANNRLRNSNCSD